MALVSENTVSRVPLTGYVPLGVVLIENTIILGIMFHPFEGVSGTTNKEQGVHHGIATEKQPPQGEEEL